VVAPLDTIISLSILTVASLLITVAIAIPLITNHRLVTVDIAPIRIIAVLLLLIHSMLTALPERAGRCHRTIIITTSSTTSSHAGDWHPVNPGRLCDISLRIIGMCLVRKRGMLLLPLLPVLAVEWS
jgi:hypothetical protein